MNHPHRRTIPRAALAMLVALSSLGALAAPAGEGCVQVEVRNLRPQQGKLMVAAYTEEADFNRQPATQIQMRAGSEPTMSFAVCGLSGPAVSLMLFQDLNANGQLDRNVFGVPSEPWGASGQTPAFSAPSWASSRVPLDGQTLVVQLSM
jgi:uncharacterized protein (DUF2141 family)